MLQFVTAAVVVSAVTYVVQAATQQEVCQQNASLVTLVPATLAQAM
jgi:hypothetical protein